MSTLATIRSLSEFRYELRKFLHFSEQAAAAASLTPQQYQLFLHIAGIADGAQPTVAYIAERMELRHHTAVELTNRCRQAGLLTKKPSPHDRRQILLALTPKGQRILDGLSQQHASELHERAPKLIAALQRVRKLKGAKA